jgi:ankyrin repeat protein
MRNLIGFFLLFAFFVLVGCVTQQQKTRNDVLQLESNEQISEENDPQLRFDKEFNQTKNDNDFIFYLIDNNNVDKINELINNNFDLNTLSSDPRSITPLVYAIQKERNDIILLLLENDVDIELCTTFGSPLVVAAENNNFDLVKLLLNKGADINNNYRFPNRFSKGRSAIFCAAYNFNFEMYDYLLERNADVNIGNDLENENALMAVISKYYWNDHPASREQIITIVRKLIHDGIDINNVVDYGNVLTITARRNDFELMEILLENGASLNNYVKERNMNTFDYICTFGTEEIIGIINKYYKQ